MLLTSIMIYILLLEESKYLEIINLSYEMLELLLYSIRKLNLNKPYKMLQYYTTKLSIIFLKCKPYLKGFLQHFQQFISTREN